VRDGRRSEVKFVILGGNKTRFSRRVDRYAIAATGGTFDSPIGSRRQCTHLEVSAPGRTPPDADIFPRYPLLHSSTRKESCGRRLLSFSRSSPPPLPGRRNRSGRSLDDRRRVPLPPWDLLRRYLAAARFLMERGLSFPGSLLFFARTDNARPITYSPFCGSRGEGDEEEEEEGVDRTRGPGTRQARARCTGRLTRDPASMVHPRVVVHTPPDAVSNAHPRPFPTTSPSPPTSQSATGGGTSPRPWSNRGGEGGRDGGGTFDIVARRVSSRLITDGGALEAWCAPVTRVGS